MRDVAGVPQSRGSRRSGWRLRRHRRRWRRAGNTELAWAQMEGARAEEGRLGLLAAGRGAGRRARRREWQLVVVVVAAAAMVAMVGAVLAVVVAVVAAERQRRPRGGRGDRRRPRSLRWRQSSVAARCQSSVAAAFYQ
jgi:hypothetical protein